MERIKDKLGVIVSLETRYNIFPINMGNKVGGRDILSGKKPLINYTMAVNFYAGDL